MDSGVTKVSHFSFAENIVKYLFQSLLSAFSKFFLEQTFKEKTSTEVILYGGRRKSIIQQLKQYMDVNVNEIDVVEKYTSDMIYVIKTSKQGIITKSP